MPTVKWNKRRVVERLALVVVIIIGLPCMTIGIAAAIGQWVAPVVVVDPQTMPRLDYSYAPAMITGDVDRIWTCHNRSSGLVRDDVFMTTLINGAPVSSRSVLSGDAGGWDSFHNCDPSVVAVDATIDGVTYHYAMFYTGNDQDCSCHNQVGVAFASSLDGPWVKYPTPVISFNDNYPASQWGEGQPGATTIDAAAGLVALTWTSGYSPQPSDSIANFAQVSFASGAPAVTGRHQIQTDGLTDVDGTPDWLNNFDLAYSPVRDSFLMVREAHPYPTSRSSSLISYI